jgi:hypothetical protein
MRLNREGAKNAKINIITSAFFASALKDGRAIARPYAHRSVVGTPNGASAVHLSYKGMIENHRHFAVTFRPCSVKSTIDNETPFDIMPRLL